MVKVIHMGLFTLVKVHVRDDTDVEAFSKELRRQGSDQLGKLSDARSIIAEVNIARPGDVVLWTADAVAEVGGKKKPADGEAAG